MMVWRNAVMVPLHLALGKAQQIRVSSTEEIRAVEAWIREFYNAKRVKSAIGYSKYS
jgi:hypothetical protein